MIRISITHGIPYVWNSNDACRLREEHRIFGYLVGCLPRWPLQNAQLGMPLRLMPEEATLLVEQGYAYLADNSKQVSRPTEMERKLFEEARQKSLEEQVEFCKERRKAELVMWQGEIEEGKDKRAERKRRRMEKQTVKSDKILPAEKTDKTTENSSIDKEKVPVSSEPETAISSGDVSEVTMATDDGRDVTMTTSDVINEVQLQEKHCLIHLPTEKQRGGSKADTPPDWKFPQTDIEKVRYRVFRDMWFKGFYLTSGCKFGGDFLVYAGEPAAFHSQYIAVCVLHQRPLNGLDIITLGRLGSSVSKTALFCSINEDDNIVYTSIKWTGVENQITTKFGLEYVCHSPKV